jgi:hypothetical protein
LAPFGQAVSEEKIFLTVANQKQELLLAAIFVGQTERNGSSIKFLCFIQFGQQIWLPRAILVSDWLMLSKSSPLKLPGQIKPSMFVGQMEPYEEAL